MKSTPWNDCPDLWKDEKAYCAWLRSQSRRIWARHPIKNRYKAAGTSIIDAATKAKYPRAKKMVKCEMCCDNFPASNIEVDHINPAGSFTSVVEWKDWLDRLLLLGFEDIRLLCKPCHLKVTLAERFHCSLENVWVYQAIAAFNKLNADGMEKALADLDMPKQNNAASRKKAYKEFMMACLE